MLYKFNSCWNVCTEKKENKNIYLFSCCSTGHHKIDRERVKVQFVIANYTHYNVTVYVTVYGKTGHNAACVNIEKRSIDFLKMYCFKPTEGNGLVYYNGNDLSYDDKTWRAQYLGADNSVSAKKNFEGCRVVLGFPVDGHIYTLCNSNIILI